MRKFSTGATRDTAANKPDYEGYLSPLVIRRFGEFMLKHQKQPDGTTRSSDNWQSGMPQSVYMSSMWRHFEDVWLHHDGFEDLATEELEEALCALMFNVMGYLYEELIEREQ